MEQGPRTHLTTLFLDRANYNVEAGSNIYGTLFEKGVVVSLYDGDRNKLISRPKDVVPAIPSKDQDEPYRAFPADWTYNPKERQDDGPSAAEDSIPSGPDQMVASWVTCLPQPEQMLPHEDKSARDAQSEDSKQLAQQGQHALPDLPTSFERPLSQSQIQTGTISYDPSQPHLLNPVNHLPAAIQNQATSQPNVLPHLWHAEPSSRKTIEASVPSEDTRKGSEKKSELNAIEEVAATLKDVVLPALNGVLPVLNTWIDEMRFQRSRSEDKPPRHTTMDQQARKKGRVNYKYKASRNPKRTEPAPKTAPKPATKPTPTVVHLVHPMFVHAISQKLASMVTGLEMFTGDLSVKVNLGRICLTEVNKNRIWFEGRSLKGHALPLQVVKNILDVDHADPGDVIFSKILTEKGADANYITQMKDGSGKKIWLGYQRRTIYEIVCLAMTKLDEPFRFVIEVDGNDFSHRIRQLSDEECSLFVHCPKRTWDFEITLSKSPRLGEDYEAFAKDLVDHMRVV